MERASPARAGLMVNMNDADAEDHFVQDISKALEGGQWRWVQRRPTVKILLVSTQRLKFVSDFTLVEACVRHTGPVTITFRIADKVLDKVQYRTPGYKHFEKPVPAGWLQTAQDTLISEEIDKVYVSPQDGAQLGFILTGMGFARQ